MPANKNASRRTLKSDLTRVDAHVVSAKEYRELPQLTSDMLARAKVKKGGRPRSLNPRKLISLRLPADGSIRRPATDLPDHVLYASFPKALLLTFDPRCGFGR